MFRDTIFYKTGGTMDAGPIIDAIHSVTKGWAKQRRSEEREASRAFRRRDALVRSERVTIRDAAFGVMRQSYLAASSGGTLPAHARQIFYRARGPVQEATGRTLDDQYFTQTLLPDYINEHQGTAADWDVVFDARGHFVEPHTGLVVPLGTLDVRDYLDGLEEAESASDIRGTSDGLFPTHGPRGRFGAVLFIEKEGFMPLFKAAQLSDRFDVAVMSTKGMSVTASRLLVDQLCSEHDIPLLVLHDFDKSGFSIVGTLQRDTRRYSFGNEIQVIDLGLRLPDVQRWELDSEDVSYGKSDPVYNLRENSATREEIEFLCDPRRSSWNQYVGRRVELNAFSSGDLIAWIEEGLTRCGVKKVVPDKETLDAAFRRAAALAIVNQRLGEIEKQAKETADGLEIPQSLGNQVRKRLKADPSLPWDRAVEAVVAEFVKKAGLLKDDSAS
jgi:hypothetical protein